MVMPKKKSNYLKSSAPHQMFEFIFRLLLSYYLSIEKRKKKRQCCKDKQNKTDTFIGICRL